jgi:hypothetical protein
MITAQNEIVYCSIELAPASGGSSDCLRGPRNPLPYVESNPSLALTLISNVIEFCFRSSLSILVLLLSFSMAFAEYSELVSLHDDVSNDFTCQGCDTQDRLKSEVDEAGISVEVIASVRRFVFDRHEFFSSFSASMPHRPGDLLHVLSIQRT